MTEHLEVISTSKNNFRNVQQGELEEKNEFNYEDILKIIGFGRVQWLVLLSSGLTLLMSVNEVMGTGIITLACQCDFELNAVDKGLLTGVSLVGNICSSYFWGYYGDTIGRRPILIASALATNAFTLISTLVPNFAVFLLLRFCVGLSLSGATNVTYAYLGEFFTAYYRPIVINYASLFIGISIIFVPAISWLVLLMDWSLEISSGFSFRPWRLLPIFYVFPGFLATLLVLYLPESPKILFSLGRYEEAYKKLDWIYKKNSGGHQLEEVVSPKLKVFGIIDSMGKKTSAGKSTSCLGIFRKMWHETYPLFQRPLARNFIICVLIMCNVLMSAISMSIWFPQIQNRVRFHTNDGDKLNVCDVMSEPEEQLTLNSTMKDCDDTIMDKTYVDFLIYGVTCCIGYIVLGTVINLLGRKMILIGFLGIAGACGLSLIWISEPLGIVISFSVFLVLAELNMSITNGIVVDLMPTHLCAQAICICLMLGRLSSVLANNLIATIMDSHCMLTFSLFSGFSILCATLSVLLPI